ncbi:MAG: DUF4395 domain-containing protein [Chloroflexi bacterium]|nr:DUF4395 domain-containing protein [Chloroflexota bacterium]
MSSHPASTEVFDVTARKFHQAASAVLLAVGFILSGRAELALLTIVGIVMLAGRFWWPADIFRQLVWRVLEPAHILPRIDRQEDHETRRVARVLGGVLILISAIVLATGGSWGWVFAAATAVLIFFDAAFDFCLLCFLAYWGSRTFRAA